MQQRSLPQRKDSRSEASSRQFSYRSVVFLAHDDRVALLLASTFFRLYIQPTLKLTFYVLYTGAQISSSRLRKDVARLASGLRNKLNLHPAPYVKGPRTQSIVSPVVLIHLPNCIPFAIIELAIWQAGLTATTANSALKPAELAHIINLSKPAAIFTLAGQDGVDIIKEALTHVENKEVVQTYKSSNRIFSIDLAADDYGTTLQSQQSSASDWKTLLQGEDPNFGFPQYKENSDENDRRAAVILWSSGTSGKSKGVILGHLAILTSVQSLFYGNPLFGPNEVFIGFAPFFHVL